MSTAVHKSPINSIFTDVSRHLPLQPPYRSVGGLLVESQPSQVSLNKEDEFKMSSLYLFISIEKCKKLSIMEHELVKKNTLFTFGFRSTNFSLQRKAKPVVAIENNRALKGIV
jgi:hypothetical protein